MNKMKIIGLTGGTGSGKGVVSAFLKNNGAYIVDADKIAHDIILKGKPAYAELVEYFGKEILGDDGEVVRRKFLFRNIQYAENLERWFFPKAAKSWNF